VQGFGRGEHWQSQWHTVRPASATRPVDAARPLFQSTGIPAQIVVDHVTAEAVQINALGHDTAGNQYFRKERAVEREHQALARFGLRGAIH